MKKVILLLTLIFLMSFISATCEEGQVDINSASLDELDTLYGIGPAKGQAIIDYRETNSFDNLDELIEVYGIGEATLNGIKAQGLACVNNEDEASNEKENTDDNETEINVSTESSHIFNSSSSSLSSNAKLEPIRLNYPAESTGKDIKSAENSEILDGETLRNRIALYGFFVFGIAMGILMIIRRKKIYQNDFQ
ncbi:MAG: helix-hairpin-helix domain-containing protein [Candidatus Pacearchaeota archaeon]